HLTQQLLKQRASIFLLLTSTLFDRVVERFENAEDHRARGRKTYGSPSPPASFPFTSFRIRRRCTRSSATFASSRARANASPYRKPASNSATPGLDAASASSSRTRLIESMSSCLSVAIVFPSLASSSSGKGSAPWSAAVIVSLTSSAA